MGEEEMKSRLSFFMITLLLGSLLASSVCLGFASGSPEVWSTQDMDSSQALGFKYSIAVDSNDYPHIAYAKNYRDHLGIHGDLIYAQYDGSAWVTQILPVNASSTTLSLVLDSNDMPHIAFFGFEYGRGWPLKYACLTESTWNIETVDTDAAFSSICSLGLDSKDNPHISYYTTLGLLSSPRNLRHAFNDGSSWQIQTINETEAVSRHNVIAIDSNNNPSIAYLDPEGTLKYARYDGSAWNTQTVFSPQKQVTSYISFALDQNDNPHICFLDHQNRTINYATNTNSKWLIETVAPASCLSTPRQIAIDTLGIPHILYAEYSYAKNANIINCSSRTSNGWVNQESIISNDKETSICSDFALNFALDSKDIPHMCFQDLRNSGRYLVYATNPTAQPPTPTPTPPIETTTPPTTPSPTPSPTSTPKATPISTPTPTPSPSPTSVSTSTPTPDPTPLVVPTPTPTPTLAPSPSSTTLPPDDAGIFFVESNSTVSELVFNSTSSELSFTVSGPTATTGYVNLTVAKSLISNPENIKVCLDGEQLICETQSNENSWLLTFTYQHSTHQVTVNLVNAVEIGPSSINPWFVPSTAVATAAIITIALAVWSKQRKRKL